MGFICAMTDEKQPPRDNSLVAVFHLIQCLDNYVSFIPNQSFVPLGIAINTYVTQSSYGCHLLNHESSF